MNNFRESKVFFERILSSLKCAPVSLEYCVFFGAALLAKLCGFFGNTYPEVVCSNLWVSLIRTTLDALGPRPWIVGWALTPGYQKDIYY